MAARSPSLEGNSHRSERSPANPQHADPQHEQRRIQSLTDAFEVRDARLREIQRQLAQPVVVKDREVLKAALDLRTGEWRRILRSEHMSRSTRGSFADFKAKAPPEAPGLIIPLPTTGRGESRLTLRGAWRGGLGHRGSLIVEAETSDIQWPRFGLYPDLYTPPA